MSFKAYDGLILNHRIGFSGFVEHIRTQATAAADRRLKEVILKICERSLTAEGRAELLSTYEGLERYRRVFDRNEVWTPVTAGDYIDAHFKAQSTSPQRNRWDLSLSVSAWEIEGRWILMPYEEAASIFSDYRVGFGLASKKPILRSLMPDRKYTRAYGYWDNADRDPKVSSREWADRKRRWHLIDAKWNTLRVVIDILSPDHADSLKVGWYMQKEWRAFKTKFKIGS